MKTLELTDREWKVIQGALRDRAKDLEQYKLFLHDSDGNKIACAYTAIGQVDIDLKETWVLIAKLYGMKNETR